MFSRVFVIVLDGFGVGSLPDSREYGEKNKSSFEDVIEREGIPNIAILAQMGFMNLTDKYFNKDINYKYSACYGKMRVESPYKDSWAGHWELAGSSINTDKASQWSDGFPHDIISLFEARTRYRVIGNRAFLRREEVIYDLLPEHLSDKKSVVILTEKGIESIRTFGIYASEDQLSLDELYALCEKTAIFMKEYNDVIGRIGARTLRINADGKLDVPHSKRKDFLIFNPPKNTVLKSLEKAGLGTYAVGKVSAMFRGEGIKNSINTRSNQESMEGIMRFCDTVDKGLIFGNLNDFDAKYGHYFDTHGWNKSLEEFDKNLEQLLLKLRDDDLVIICSDGHGCDSVYTGIHTREYSPLIIYNKNIKCGKYIGINNYLNDIAATISDNFNLNFECKGKSLLEYIT